MRRIKFHAKGRDNPRIRWGLSIFIAFAISQQKENKVRRSLQSFSIMIRQGLLWSGTIWRKDLRRGANDWLMNYRPGAARSAVNN
jgi:hypothetical protein